LGGFSVDVLGRVACPNAMPITRSDVIVSLVYDSVTARSIGTDGKNDEHAFVYARFEISALLVSASDIIGEEEKNREKGACLAEPT